MDWTSFVGHHRQRDWFANAIASNRLASTFLMVGPSGIGKRAFAGLVAKTLLCTTNEPADFQPCGHCETCIQVAAGTHPDVIVVQRDKDKSNLSMEQLVGSDESRMREGLCYELRMRPYSGRRKIAIVDDADTLAVEGANSLLKTLEEPPPGSVIFLIGTSEQRQLRTIRSRSQIVRFSPLAEQELSTLILRNGLADNPVDATRIAQSSHGSIERAKQTIDAALDEFRQQLIVELCAFPIDFPKLSKWIVTHLGDASTTENQVRRDRLKWVLNVAIDVYRDTMREQLGLHSRGSLDPSTEAVRSLAQRVDSIGWVRLIQRTQEAREQVDRNVSPAALLEAWTAEIASLSRA
jgi:DNA polymerase III subunit delta'